MMATIKSILIVDDNEIDHIITKSAIEAYGAEITVHEAYDGKEALTLLDTLPVAPEVILLDINMPGMNGLEFLVEYEKAGKMASAVVMLTTSEQSADKAKCLSYSFVKEYLMKPIESEDLERLFEIL